MTSGSSMTEVTVASLGLDKSSNTPVVILRESGGERLLPIWIGGGGGGAGRAGEGVGGKGRDDHV